ncbi:MAG: hypothetical protein KKC64_16290, partial [Spirochaetes bacterium]|nr:hypothetical protein [Spirochaetota bacterium]
MQFLLAGEEQFEAVYQFCQLMIRTDARMSFTDVTERSVLRSWYDDPAVQLYAAVDLPSAAGLSGAAGTAEPA